MTGRVDRLWVSDKDPEYYYRWVNNKDTNVMEYQLQGYRPVEGQDPAMRLVPIQGQNTTNPVSEAVRQRGDLILMRIDKQQYEETVGRAEIAARERAESSLDTMVLQADENAKAAARKAGLKRMPPAFVFHDEGGRDGDAR